MLPPIFYNDDGAHWAPPSVLHGCGSVGATAELRLMLDLVAGREGQSVTDPYYGADNGFAETWDDVSAVAAALVASSRG